MDRIIERIERDAGTPGLVSILAERLTPTDLQSLLLEVYRIRSVRLKPASVLADYIKNRFVRPAMVSPVSLLRWEQIAYSNLPEGFTPLNLSPVCPFGAASVVGPVSQDWVMTSSRNTEVVSDSTNVLALECSILRKKLLRANPRSSETVHLAANHRLLRTQSYTNLANSAHFSAFSLCSAGRDQGRLQFELSTLGLHIRYYLKSLQAFLGPDVPLQLSVTDLSTEKRVTLIETQLLSGIRSEYEQVECGFDDNRTKGRGYYGDVCFNIHGATATGQRLELVDGGCVNWTQKYLNNSKERLVISGIGSERLCTGPW